MGTYWYLHNSNSETGLTPVYEDDYVMAISSIAKRHGIEITDKMILQEIFRKNKKKTKSVKKNDFFQKKVVMECYRGSIAHGLYLDPKEEFGTDDIDKLVVFVYPKEYYFSLHGYLRERDVFEEKKKEEDIVGYELRKMFHLLSQGNPNVLLTLWLRKKHYLTLTPAWKEVIKNRRYFLARDKLYKTFLGYAQSQFKKMEAFQKQDYMGEKRLRLVKKFGYDTKNASHLIRLLRMGIEVLKTGEFQVYRDKDRDELLAIKQGNWGLEKVKHQAEKLFKKFDSVYLTSKLPKEIDKQKINQLLIRVMEI